MNNKENNPTKKIISGIVCFTFLVVAIRGYIRSQLNLSPISFSSEEQLFHSSDYNPFDHSLEQDMANSRQLELNRREHHRNIMSQLAANEQQETLIMNIDILAVFLIIGGSSAWAFYCCKIRT